MKHRKGEPSEEELLALGRALWAVLSEGPRMIVCRRETDGAERAFLVTAEERPSPTKPQ